jgi:hypothetical protein
MNLLLAAAAGALYGYAVAPSREHAAESVVLGAFLGVALAVNPQAVARPLATEAR